MAVFSKKKLAETRGGGPFVASILLNKTNYDLETVVNNLKSDWNIKLPKGSVDSAKNTLYCSIDGITATITLVESPISGTEAVDCAKTNFRWDNAEPVAIEHKAHLSVTVLQNNEKLTKAGITLVKLCASCLVSETATGILTSGTVLEPEFYVEMAKEYIDEDSFPIWNMIFFGMYSQDKGETFCAYTHGMKCFNKLDLEIIDCHKTPEDIIELLNDIAEYVIDEDVVLKDGETIGFTEEQKLTIVESNGIAIPAHTLKIGF